MSSNNKVLYSSSLLGASGADMATATRALMEFSGDKNEDPQRWIKTARLLRKIHGLNDHESLRLMIGALRGEAQSWVADSLDQILTWSVEEFESGLIRRFEDSSLIDKILEKFLSRTTVCNNNEHIYIYM